MRCKRANGTSFLKVYGFSSTKILIYLINNPLWMHEWQVSSFSHWVDTEMMVWWYSFLERDNLKKTKLSAKFKSMGLRSFLLNIKKVKKRFTNAILALWSLYFYNISTIRIKCRHWIAIKFIDPEKKVKLLYNNNLLEGKNHELKK